MTTQIPQIIIFDIEDAVLEPLRTELKDVPHVSVVRGNGPSVTASKNLDALWLTWMQAGAFGAQPPFPIHDAVVFPMPAARIAAGLPRYMIAGGALSPNDSRTPEYEANLMLEVLVRAVTEFNKTHDEQISRIGTVPGNIGFDKLTPRAAATIFNKFSRLLESANDPRGVS